MPVIRLMVAACLLCLPAGQRAVGAEPERPIRVYVPAVLPDHTVGNARICRILLRERLQLIPGVRLVDGGRGNAIAAELNRGLRDDITPETRLRLFSHYVPLDDMFTVDGTSAGTLMARAYGPDGIAQREITGKDIWTVARQIIRWSVDFMHIPAARRPPSLLQPPIVPTSLIAPIMTADYLTARWPNNGGEARLKILVRPWSGHRGHPALAAAILRAVKRQLESTSREQGYTKKAIDLGAYALAAALGTGNEDSALAMIRQRPDAFAGILNDSFRASRARSDNATIDDTTVLEALDAEDDDGQLSTIDAAPTAAGTSGATAPAATPDPARRAAAAQRLLAAIGNREALASGPALAASPDPFIRLAAVHVLALSARNSDLQVLAKLVADTDDRVAFAAAAALATAGEESPKLSHLVRRLAGNPTLPPPLRARVLTRLSSLADRDDEALLRTLLRDDNGDARAAAAQALARLGILGRDLWRSCLDDPDSRVVIAALEVTPEQLRDGDLERLAALVDDPFPPVADAARNAVRRRPTPPAERAFQILDTEHFLLRFRVVDAFAKTPGEAGLAGLERACANGDFYVRARALKRLFARDAPRAHRQAMRLLADPYPWTRLVAAGILAKTAGTTDATALERAQADERDAAIHLYLADALARAKGLPPPPPPPAAHDTKTGGALTWFCGVGEDAETSPFGAYYLGNTKLSAKAMAAHAKGKVLFCRVETVGHPGSIMISRNQRHHFWRSIAAALTPTVLAHIDGVVFGEETMQMHPSYLWKDGWRLFCIEAGIAPDQVQGDRKKLSPRQSAAFTDWAGNLTIDGFNELYEHIKLRYGKLRPGIQVCTFLPGEEGDHIAADRWTFDWAGIYDYKGCNRMAAYNQIRRCKTLWPDRPVLWLSLGIGGYEMNPVRRNQKLPKSLIFSRGNRAWADSISAYVAGANPGWFSTWIAVAKDWSGTMATLSGRQFNCEDIGSPIFEKAVDYAWRGAAKDDFIEVENLADQEISINLEADADAEDGDIGEIDADEKAAARAKMIAKTIAADQNAFRRGFAIYKKYIYDCARIFASLPRLRPRPRALVIRGGTNVWTRPTTPYPLIPANALLTQYDYLGRFDLVPSLNLDRYRLIIVHDPGLLRDATIRAIRRWLEQTPGVLYVHRYIEEDDNAESPSIDDLDGRLQADWPWEGDVTLHRRLTDKQRARAKPRKTTFSTAAGETTAPAVLSTVFEAGKNCRVLARVGDAAALAVWTTPEFRGAVVFDGVQDAARPYLELLAGELNRLAAAGVGIAVGRPSVWQEAETPAFVAAASSRYYRALATGRTLSGIDVLSGTPAPTVGHGSAGALVLKAFQGRYMARKGALTILSEAPLELSETNGATVIRAAGLVRISAAADLQPPQRVDGGELPEIADDGVAWVLWGATAGRFTLRRGKAPPLLYFRSPAPVRVITGR